tara:strand:- start:404 stop:628 length:225 start_codon:yes stop_codon:yes gene_type:complete
MTIETINIGEQEYKLEELPVSTQADVNRIAGLRQEAAQLEMRLRETNVLISAYSNAVTEAVKPVEEAKEEVDAS